MAPCIARAAVLVLAVALSGPAGVSAELCGEDALNALPIQYPSLMMKARFPNAMQGEAGDQTKNGCMPSLPSHPTATNDDLPTGTPLVYCETYLNGQALRFQRCAASCFLC